MMADKSVYRPAIQITVHDVDEGGRPDFVVATTNGTFVFLREKKTVCREEWEKAQPKVRSTQ